MTSRAMGQEMWESLVPKSHAGSPFAATAALVPITDTPPLGRRFTHAVRLIGANDNDWSGVTA